MTKHKAGVLHFGWILFADAVTRIVKEHGVADREAARQIITAARQGALYTQGRLHHAKGQPFAIAHAAWDGMDPYPALSMLCTPNPDTEVQEPFLAMPNVHAVEIHAGSFEAWLAGKERPPVPIMQPITMSFALRYSALIWRELHFAADTKMAATAKVGEEVPVEAANPPEIRPGPKPGLDQSTKAKSATAVKQLIADGTIDPNTHGAVSAAARILVSRPEFEHYQETTIADYARPVITEAKSRRISPK
jgi:hypothetical protein